MSGTGYLRTTPATQNSTGRNTHAFFSYPSIPPGFHSAGHERVTSVLDLTFGPIQRRLAGRSPRRIVEAEAAQAAVALILVPAKEGRLDLLLIKRSERVDDPWSGQMALPGGRRERADPDLLGTASRETQEETGIALPRSALLGELDDLHPRTKVLPSIIVRPFVFGLSERPAITQGHEVALHLWAPLRRFRGSGTPSKVSVRGETLEVPSYVVESHIVWGMTHRIVKSFIDLIP